MYLVSAIDFVFIFVALELVTVSFYVLVSFTRRNPTTLEAGTKYLVLSALSTGFLVYGIAWIFGATGQTNLYRLTAALANPGSDSGAALLGMVFVLVALGFKDCGRPLSNLGAGCLSRCAHASDCVSLRRFESSGVRRVDTCFATVHEPAANTTADLCDRAAHIDLRQSRSAAADEPEADCSRTRALPMQVIC
jgi:hypothetical protein